MRIIRRSSRGRCAATLVILSLFAGLAWAAAAVTAPGSAGASRSSTTSTAQDGQAPFGSCGAGAIEMLVSIPRTTYRRGQNIDVTALIRNVGTTPCTFARIGPIPAPGSPQAAKSVGMGPCGAIPMEVRNEKGTVIWPGAVFCPLISTSGPGLQPGGQLIAKGSWNQEIQPGGGGKTSFHGSVGPVDVRAPRGIYAVVVDQRFTFHIRFH